jgi:malonyl-CoA O-methyltransferase
VTPSPVEPPLSAREAYRLWADGYEGETAVSAMEARAVAGVTPPLAGLSLLDAGCGTGRRLRAVADETRLAVGADLVPEMLAAGARAARSGAQSGLAPARPVVQATRPVVVSGDVRELPFPARLFDILWCRLVLGHVPALEPAYEELGRVARPGGILVVSDFHPAAAAAGHRRTFRDGDGRVREVVHHGHDLAGHERAAKQAGWALEATLDVEPGPQERVFWERAGRAGDYEEQQHLPLVLVMLFSC